MLTKMGKAKVLRFRRWDQISVSYTVELKGDRHADSEDMRLLFGIVAVSVVCRPLGSPESSGL